MDNYVKYFLYNYIDCNDNLDVTFNDDNSSFFDLVTYNKNDSSFNFYFIKTCTFIKDINNFLVSKDEYKILYAISNGYYESKNFNFHIVNLLIDEDNIIDINDRIIDENIMMCISLECNNDLIKIKK